MGLSILALLTRALRDGARLRRAHAFRIGMMLILLGMLIQAHYLSGGIAAPGLNFFRSLAFLNVALITLAGAGYFASAITEEKEEGTIGLLIMADLSVVSILLGKSTSRLVAAALVFA